MNRGNKRSTVISEIQVKSVLKALEYANYKDWPLNQFLSIHLERGQIEAEDQSKFITKFTKYAGDCFRRFGFRWVAISILESPPGGGRNWRLLFHLPPELEWRFQGCYRIWLKWAGLRDKRKVVRRKTVGSSGKDYRVEIIFTIFYMLKGADKEASYEIEGLESEYQGT